MKYWEAEKICDIPFICNYLALYVVIKGCIIKEEGKEYTKEELRQLPRRYIYSNEALKLMGLDIKESEKMNK